MQYTQVNNKQREYCENNLKYILDKSKQLTNVNKKLHPTGTLNTTFHKPNLGKQIRFSFWIWPTENLKSQPSTSSGINEFWSDMNKQVKVNDANIKTKSPNYITYKYNVCQKITQRRNLWMQALTVDLLVIKTVVL